MERILVQIASYRDADLPNTINSALANATVPERLRFGICWQYDEHTYTDLDPYLRDDRFRVFQCYYEQSKGCCWARHQTNRLYRGEEYTLQIDAHSRFAEAWDQRFLRMHQSLPCERAILSTYPAPFEVVDGEEKLYRDRGVQKLVLNRIKRDLTTVYKAEVVDDPSVCAPSQFLAAGQLFTLGRFCRDVEYDPELYYSGEEISLAARAFTHGYDFYCPNEDLIWHLYRHEMRTHWADHPDTLHERAMQRLRWLLLGEHERLGPYGLGAERSLSAFERSVDICFSERVNRQPSPVRLCQTISLDVSEIETRSDYHFWIFTLRNVDDEEIYRRDVYDADVLAKRTVTIELDEELPDEPVSYMIWPNIREQGFAKQYFRDL